MPRLLFEKTGNAVFISHLDLMRLFQRAFQRANLPLTHSKGFNPRPEVSIALPLSVGVESICELLDFNLESELPEDLVDRLNRVLISGVTVRELIQDGRKIRDLRFLRCEIRLEYDKGIPEGTEEALDALFSREEILVEKKGKNGVVMQNIREMMDRPQYRRLSSRELEMTTCICCQNPTLNPSGILNAISLYAPEFAPSFSVCRRTELYDENKEIFR